MSRFYFLFSSCFFLFPMLFVSKPGFAQQRVDTAYHEKQNSSSLTYNNMSVQSDLKVDSLNVCKRKEELVVPVREKKFIRAGSEWFLAQAFPASFNRFITKDPYSYISFKNFIDHQRISAWDWDDNQFTTNHIDHPFHGQLYRSEERRVGKEGSSR